MCVCMPIYMDPPDRIQNVNPTTLKLKWATQIQHLFNWMWYAILKLSKNKISCENWMCLTHFDKINMLEF